MKVSSVRGILLFGLLFSSVYSVAAQSPRDWQQRISAPVERQDDAAAIAELKSFRKSDPASFTLNNYDYLLARLAEQRGDRAGASASYQAIVSQSSSLKQYALWHLAQFARTTGNLTLEREQLRRLITSAPSSLLRPAAVFRLAQSFFESGDYPQAIVALGPISAPKLSASSRAAMLLLGEAYLRSGQTPAARATFDTLISQASDPSRPDDNALAAARHLDELDNQKSGGNENAAPALPEGEHLRRAAIYQFNRDFDAAQRHYRRLVADYPQSTSIPDSMYQIGRGMFQQAKYEAAISYLRQVQEKFPNSPSARDALGLIAGAQNRLKQTAAAIASYQLLIERYPEAPNPERPYLNIIDALREGGRDNDALEWVQQTRRRFKGQTAAALALFSQARIHFAQADWPAALADIEALSMESDLGGAQTAGSTNQNELAFMKAYALEQSARLGEAVGAYLAIPDGRSEYYGGEATLRLRGLSRQAGNAALIVNKLEELRTTARQASESGDHDRARVAAQSAVRLTEDESITRELLTIARGAYENLPAYNSFPQFHLVPMGRQGLRSTNESTETQDETVAGPSHQNIADELLFLGLYDEGAAELAAARAAVTTTATLATDTKSKPAAPETKTLAPQSRQSDLDYTLAVYFMRGGNANQAMRFGQTLWKNVPRDYLIALAPRQLAELLYPAPYAAALLAHGPKRGIDPRFLLAIARQESGFMPEAKSASAARGLMQFISATAADIAAQVGKSSFRDQDLYEPDMAILFGAQYLSNLFKRFPEMPQAVAASYNGGDENMARWIARAKSNDPDRYVLEVGFAQSKDYVYRVMSNYRAYQILYSNQLQAR
ncbi:MAG: soluble lytic murein transglycosylase [Blastocatellia bacterium]|jgi:soluble lytic murein transglycosylase|nr:soluble lytic murein transglycosylase [Blastocatellia bacterium]